MDGPHRWAGSWLAGGPSTKMTAVQVQLLKDELIPVLAAIGDHFHPGKRNPGAQGGVSNIFTSDESEVGDYIRRLNEEDGITKYMTRAEANRITEMAGGIDELINLFEKHAAQMKSQKGGGIAGLPPRDEMPVIRSSEVAATIDAIEKGQVDIMAPYRPELNEKVELPKEIYTAMEEELMKSQFWTQDNEYEDIEEDTPMPETPATQALTLAINKALQRAKLDDIVGISHSSGDYSNDLWRSATIDVSEDGTPVIMILMNLFDSEELENFTPESSVKEVSAALRHEIVHIQQLKAQAKKQGIGLQDAFEKMMDDPKQVADRKEYDTYEEFMQAYLAKHIEVDAHAHQAAENLLDKYDEQEALDVISKDLDLDDPALPDEVKKYHNFDVEKKKMDKFRSKIYTYIKKFVEDKK